MNAKIMQTGYAQIVIRCLACLTCAAILLPVNPQVLARPAPRSVDDQAVRYLRATRFARSADRAVSGQPAQPDPRGLNLSAGDRSTTAVVGKKSRACERPEEVD